MKRAYTGVLFFAALVFVLGTLWYIGTLPSFEDVQGASLRFQSEAMTMPVTAGIIFVLAYTLVVALSLPLATALSLLGGFLFGSVWGTLLVVFGATCGATIIFALARFFFRDFFIEKFGERVKKFDADFEHHGFRNVFFLRLTPLIPFVLINVAAALSKVKIRDYVLGTFSGIIPFAYVYVEAGNQLAHITSPGDAVPLSMILQRSALALVIFGILLYRARRAKKATLVENALLS